MGLLKALLSMHANTNENLLHCFGGLYFFKMLDCVILVIKFQWNNTIFRIHCRGKKKLVFVFYLTDVARNHSRRVGLQKDLQKSGRERVKWQKKEESCCGNPLHVWYGSVVMFHIVKPHLDATSPQGFMCLLFSDSLLIYFCASTCLLFFSLALLCLDG